MPNTYFGLFNTLLNTATKSLKECVHNRISFPDINGLIYNGSFTYCEEFFYITDGVTSSLPKEVTAILTNQNCAEPINATPGDEYDFTCNIAGYTCHSSDEVAWLVPELNRTHFCNYSISQYVTECFSFMIQTACEKRDALQAALDESTKRKFALMIGSAFAIAGLGYGLYSIYKRRSQQEKSKEEKHLLTPSSSGSNLETPPSVHDSIESQSPRLNSRG